MTELPQLFMRLPRLSAEHAAGDELSERATPDDAARIATLLSAAYDEEWDAARVLQELGPSEGVDASYVVREGDVVVAVASSRHLEQTFPGVGYLHYVAADSVTSGRGLGGVVTRAVLRHFLEEGLVSVVLETDDFRLPAIRTYLKIGFVPDYRHEEDQARWSRVLPMVVGTRPTAMRGTNA